VRRPATVTTVFLAALGATTAGTVAAGASPAVTLGSALAVLGVTAAAGSVWLGKTPGPATSGDANV
jgi:hypothetical protein